MPSWAELRDDGVCPLPPSSASANGLEGGPSAGTTAGGIIVKISVAYGSQLAGAAGVELSLGEIAHSGNTICGRRADRRVKLAGVTSVARYLLPGRKRRLAPRREPHAYCYSPKTTMFMKRRTVTGRTVGRIVRKVEIQVIEKKQVIRSRVVTDAFFIETAPEAAMFMKIKAVTSNL